MIEPVPEIHPFGVVFVVSGVHMTTDSAFVDVPPSLVDALNRKGFSELTAIQQAVLRPELKGRDLRMSSQTGSGKTVAIGFVVVDCVDGEKKRLKRKQSARPDVLVVAPTRELAAQIGNELTWLYRDINACVVTVTGGTNMGLDFAALGQNPSVLVGTPGRLVDHIQRGSVDLSCVRSVVLDEADEMLDMGFREELQAIFEATPNERRTHLVSATFPREVRRLADSYQEDPAHISGTEIGVANADIDHIAHVVGQRDRLSALINVLLMGPNERTLVFVRTRLATSQIASELLANGFHAAALSGEMSQRERTATLESFRNNAVQCLVATDVAARGLDIHNVARVVHFDVPENSSTYTHRSGRTGRAGKEGTSIALVPPSQRHRVEQIAHRAGVTLSWRDVPTPSEIYNAADSRLLARFQGDNTSEFEGKDARFGDLAKKLLAEHEPTVVVAQLLAEMVQSGPCEPRQVHRPPSSSRNRSLGRGPGGFRNEQQKGKGRGGRPFAAPRRGGNEQQSDFTVFHVTWGARSGANPSRLLALACRRGDVRSQNIGAIRVSDNRSTIEVASHLAKDFAKAARRPDTRNPKIRIQLFDEEKNAGRRSKSRAA